MHIGAQVASTLKMFCCGATLSMITAGLDNTEEKIKRYDKIDPRPTYLSCAIYNNFIAV